MTRPIEDYRLVGFSDLLYPIQPDDETHWAFCEATLAEHEELQGPVAEIAPIRLTDERMSMDWLGIGIIRKGSGIFPANLQAAIYEASVKMFNDADLEVELYNPEEFQ